MKKLLLLTSCLFFSIAARNASAAVTYWDPEGTYSYAGAGSHGYSGSMSETWEHQKWCASYNATTSQINWIEGNAAAFSVGSGVNTPAFTVTMNGNHTVAGFFDGSLNPNASQATIAGTGIMMMAANNLNAFACDNSTDGGLGNVTVNVVIAGPVNGGIAAEEASGQQFLNAVNTFQGGTYLGYSGNSFRSIWNFNNSASFGPSNITFLFCNGGALVAEGTSAITLPNNVVNYNYIANPTILNIVGVPWANGGVTFTGAWQMSGGTPGQGAPVYATNGTVLPAYGPVSIGSGGSAGNLVTIAGVLSGTNAFNKYGVATLALTANNTFSGTMTVSNGTLALTNGGSVNSASSITVLANGVFDVTGVDPYTLSASTTFKAFGAGTAVGTTAATITDSATSGNISLGSQPILLGFTPTLFTGDTAHPSLYVSSGALTFNNNVITVSNAAATALGAGTYTLIQVAGGTITGAPLQAVNIIGKGLAAGCQAYTQVSSGNVNLVVLAPANSPVWNGSDYSTSPDWSDPNNWVGLASPVAGDAVTFDGSVTPPIMDNNNLVYSLSFAPTAGVFTLANSGSTVLTVSSGLTNSSVNLQTLSMPVQLNDGLVNVAMPGAGGSVTLNGAVADLGQGLAISGANTLTLGAVNTYTGPTTIGSGSTLVIADPGQLRGGSYAGAITATGTLTYNSSAAQVLSGAISGAGAFNANGGAVTLSAVNPYTGPISITAGSLTLSGAASLGSGTYAANISDATSLVYNSTASQTVSGIISGLGTLTQGAGTLTLSGANTYSGNTIINAGTLKTGGAGDLGDLGGGIGNYAGTITDNGTLSLGSTATQTLSGNISGTGAVTVTAGNVTLSGANGYASTTSLTGGTLNVSSISDTGTANLPSNSFTFGGASTFNYTGSAPVTTGRLFTGNSGATATFNFTGDVTITNRITGSSKVTYNGPGTLTLANRLDDSSFTMTINAPVIAATASTSSIHVMGGNSSIGAAGSLKLAGTGNFVIYSGMSITNILGGVLDLGGQSNSFASLYLASPGGNPALISSVTSSTAVITNSTSNVVLLGNTIIGGAGNIVLASGVYGGATSSTLTYSGTGTLTLECTNYTMGAVTVASGSLLLGKISTTNGALVSATATVEAQNNATFGCAATTGICGVAGATTFDTGASALFTAVGGNTTTIGEIFVTNALTLNNTPVTINVTGASALAAGTYVLMTNTGTLTGSAALGAPTITGTPLASGSTATISMNGNSVVLTVTAATPVFSALSAKTITYGNGGSSTVTLTGTIGVSGIYPANGEVVSATIGSGLSVNGAVNNTTGAFSITYTDPTIKTDSVIGGPTYTITYNYAGNGTTMTAAAPDSSTVLTVNPLAVQLSGSEPYNGTTTIAGANLTVANAINGDTVTVGGTATLVGANVPSEAISSYVGLTLGGAQGGNYTLTGATATGPVTVTAVPLVITALAQSVPYGTAVPTTTVSYNTFVGPDNAGSLTTPPTVNSTLSGIQPVGSYPGNYTASGAVDGNYSISYVAGDLTVVNPFNPFAITSAALDATGTNLVVCWTSVPGVSYNILTNGDLTTTNWVDVGAPLSPTGPVAATNTCVTLPGATNTNVFVLIKQN